MDVSVFSLTYTVYSFLNRLLFLFPTTLLHTHAHAQTHTHTCSFIGFEDYSPEEVRWAAYQANNTGVASTHVSVSSRCTIHLNTFTCISFLSMAVLAHIIAETF